MQRFKSWDEIEPTATEAEWKLKEAVEAGDVCVLGTGDLPPEPDDWSNLPTDRHIRADVLRFFLLSEDYYPEKWITLSGAYISAELNLANCDISVDLKLCGCRFQHPIFAPMTTWQRSLTLQFCNIPAIDLSAAHIAVQLSFKNSSFGPAVDYALRLQATRVDEDFFLGPSTISGAAHLMRLMVGGQLSCRGCNISCKQEAASPPDFGLTLQGAKVKSDFFFDGLECDSPINLASAHVQNLAIEQKCWPPRGDFILDGFTYERLDGGTDAKSWLEWLANGDTWKGEFFPQPYKQLAKVLHDMGHEADATNVRVALGKKLRHHARKERIANAKNRVHRLWAMATTPGLWIWHSLSLLLTGHGFRPGRSLIALVLLWILATTFAHFAWEEGSFAPNSAVALQSDSWAKYDADHNHPPHPNPAKDWSLTSTIGRDWESFNRYAYAADLVVPIIDLGQTDAWAPSTTRGPCGWHLWWARWGFTLFGWIVTALGAAALTGIIRRE
jgi:hypothetical protein